MLTLTEFTTKDDLRAAYPLGMMAVPPERLARLHASSGTTGRPTLVGHTLADLDAWADLVARNLHCAGVRPGMVAVNALPFGATTGGFGFQQGLERLGATAVPVAGMTLDAQAALIRDLAAEVLVCTPSYAAQLAGVVGDDSGLRIGLFGGEMWTRTLRRRIESALGLVALDCYGLSEVVGPGVACECIEARDGMHVFDDDFTVEVIDPRTGDPLAPGAIGELVITTLHREAMPLTRYRTGDIASLDHSPCACGRTAPRITGVLGRRDDVLCAPTGFFPAQVERVLLAQPGVGTNYQLVAAPDGVTVHCEGTASAGALAAVLRGELGLELRVIVEPAGALPRRPGKAQRVRRES
jgi:phenylacetate-CoA ligase